MDYQKIGFRCGLEIHQQLEGRKLFCHCPTRLRDDLPDFTLARKLRAVAGEGGEVDTAAEQEQLKSKTFFYQGYHNSTCLVECDEEPPRAVNQEALYCTLQFCRMVEAEVPPIVQVMRKTVVDGSNTAGFQRTALIARKGKILLSTGEASGEVSLENINLEEDAARIIDEKTDSRTFCLDRLGIPLIEIGTGPDIKSPEQCLEAARKLGMLLRSLPNVKRGLGTIRQDVNVSIKGGARVEIKGAQELKQLPLLVELEVKRQQELIKIKEELKSRRLNGLKIVELSTLMQDSASGIIKEALEGEAAEGPGKVMGIKLHGLASFLGRELQPGYRVGSELSGRARIKAGVGGLFHSDELPNYGITEAEIKRIRKKLDCQPADAFVLVAGEEERARKALAAAYERAVELWEGVPREVRKAAPDGTTSYLRPMPGAARMYPETDVPLIYPDLAQIELPELLEEKIKRFQEEFRLSPDLAVFLARSDKVSLFEELAGKHPSIKPAFIAETLTSTLLDIKRQYQLDPGKLTDGHFRDLFRHLQENKIHKDIVLDVLLEMIKGTFDVRKYASLGTEEIHRVIKEIVEKNKTAPLGALMGLCMKALAGKASGKFISEELKKLYPAAVSKTVSKNL